LCVVDNDLGVISLYQTFARFDLRIHRGGAAPLVLFPGAGETGKVANWDGIQQEHDLGAPILRVTAQELFSSEILNQRLRVLETWVRIEQRNLLLRDAGLFRFGGPWEYMTNNASFGALAEKGLAQPTDEEIGVAINFLGEALDCVGSQLARRGDATAAFLSLVILRWLKRRFGKNIGTLSGLPLHALEAYCHTLEKERYMCESADRFIDEIENDPRVQALKKEADR
jgi:hypothetical protein